MLAWIIGYILLGSFGALAGAAALLLFPERVRVVLVPVLVSYATGTLLGAAFLGMLPASLKQAAPEAVTGTVLSGLILFFVLEKLVLWHHCHDSTCEVHGRAGPMILIGDAVHNFVDGAVIAAAFLTSFPLGVATALAVVAHEVPQEIGDFAILLDNGYERGRALLLNGLSASATLPGAVLAYFWLDWAREAIPYILAISAASFIYIAVADLIPGLHRVTRPATAVMQVLLLLLGVGTIALFRLVH